MSRITITKKRNGRYYVEMAAQDFAVLRVILNGMADIGEVAKFTPLSRQVLARFKAAINTPARGEVLPT